MDQPADQRKNERADSGLWSKLQQATAEERTPGVDLWRIMEQRLDPSLKQPQGIAHAEIARHLDSHGDEYYILNNPDARTYLKVDARDHFLWELMDGQHSVRDLAVAYFSKFGAFPFDRLVQLLMQLKENHFLEEKSVDIFGTLAEHFAARRLLYHLQRFSETFTQKELSLKHADRFFDTLYKWGGWLFFTRPAKILYGILTVCGLVFLLREVLAGTYPLMSTAGSYGLGLIILMLLNYVMMFFHECGHALTCKSYGRQVPRAGVLLYLGSLAWFVDTTDIWMAPKRARIAVSLAGPFATVLLGSVLATVVAISPPSPLHSTLFQAAFMGFASALMNMTPLIECDGYFVLMDWLEIPMVRTKSLAFVREKLLSKLFRERSPFSREERIFSVFGVLVAAWTGSLLLMAVYFWQSRVRMMAQELLSGRDILSTVLAGGLLLVTGTPIVLGLSIKALLFASQGAARVRGFVRTHRFRRS